MTTGTAVPARTVVVEHVMGMPVSIHLRGDTEALDGPVDASVRALVTTLHEVDAVLSPYRPASDVRRLARGALAPADAHRWTREVENRCESWRVRTHGLFDPAYGGTDPDGGPLPWDPTGLVKGWAVDLAARALREAATRTGTDWYVCAGGDVALAAHGGRSWRLGVQDPADPRSVLAVVELADGAVATSGTAARGDHVHDPRTGRPPRHDVQVSVEAARLEEADVLATAAVAAGEGAQELLRALAPARWWVVHPGGRLVSRT